MESVHELNAGTFGGNGRFLYEKKCRYFILMVDNGLKNILTTNLSECIDLISFLLPSKHFSHRTGDRWSIKGR